MTKCSHLSAWCVLCLASLVLSPLWPGAVSPGAFEADVARVQAAFGPRLTGWVLAGVGAIDPGHGAAPAHGDAADERRHRDGPRVVGAGRLVLDRVEHYTRSLRLQWMRSALKALVMAAWALLLLPVAAAAIVDGLARRAVKVSQRGYQNPAAFALASHALIASAMLPCLVLAAPFGVSPWFMPVWALLALLPLNVALRHLQPVFTR